MPDRPDHWVIANPTAGRGRGGALLPKMEDLLVRGTLTYRLTRTSGPGDARDVAKRVVDSGFARIIVVGGDGTINEVANALIGTNVAMAVIPAGTGNDYARMMGIPFDLEAAVSALKNGVECSIDLGHVNGERCFVNGLGIGIDAQVARGVMAERRLRGVAAYLYVAVKEVFRFEAFPVTVVADELNVTNRCLSLGVANGQFSGGGFRLAPNASVVDGRIDVVAVGDFSRIERLVRLPQARAGRHLGLARVHYAQVKRATISSDSRLVAHLDGEPYELPRRSLEVGVHPSALRVVVPDRPVQCAVAPTSLDSSS